MIFLTSDLKNRKNNKLATATRIKINVLGDMKPGSKRILAMEKLAPYINATASKARCDFIAAFKTAAKYKIRIEKHKYFLPFSHEKINRLIYLDLPYSFTQKIRVIFFRDYLISFLIYTTTVYLNCV
ncbi:MAG: hypothetical protein M3Q56_03230 [Bacteroidota bacterium]|nr:hypothetical protein [Bacteroidota bacterium]